MNLFKRRSSAMPERRRPEKRGVLESDASSVFRRGRTLTGSASSHVRAPSEMKADLKSPRIHSHELVHKRQRLLGVFGIVLLITTGLFFLVSQFTATPVVRASPDPSLQLDSLYYEAIDEYLTDHSGERLRIFTDESRLTRYVQAVAPEVQSIQVRGSVGFGESLFEVVFREPIASWDVGGRQLYVDTMGVPFSRNYFGSPSLRIVDQNGGVATDLRGQSIMSNRFMSYIGQIIGLSKNEGYAVTSITIPEGMTRQVDVRLDGVDYPVKFSSDRAAGESVDDMLDTLRWMSARQISPEYVDVRVGGKVFYR